MNAIAKRKSDPFGVTSIMRNEFSDPFTGWIDDFFKHTFAENTGVSYPPYDIIKKDSGKYVLNVAVAGLSKDDIETYIDKDGNLCISGEKTEDTEEYMYQGIAKRKFNLKFRMPRDSEVDSCKLEDGMLQLEILAREEENSRKSIPIM